MNNSQIGADLPSMAQTNVPSLGPAAKEGEPRRVATHHHSQCTYSVPTCIPNNSKCTNLHLASPCQSTRDEMAHAFHCNHSIKLTTKTYIGTAIALPLDMTLSSRATTMNALLHPPCLSAFPDSLVIQPTPLSIPYGIHTLNSYVQPIYGLSAQRPVGYEALLRPVDSAGKVLSPLTLLNNCSEEQRLHLDRTCHFLHLSNFPLQKNQDCWLFLNMTPEAFLQARKARANDSFGAVLEKLNFPPHQLVIEVLEEAVQSNAEFESAVAYFRELGCLIALDDFGAGSSNFDRVWKIRPKIVKLDRNLIAQAAQEKQIRRLLPQIVSLLHEAGAMVLAEGIETEEEAYIALDSDVDFAQGYLLGRPQPFLAERGKAEALISQLWGKFGTRTQHEREQHKQALAPYLNAIGYASVLLSAGRSMQEACASFLELELSDFSYLLDQQGRQIGLNLWSPLAAPKIDPRLAPLADTRGSRWSRRPYFRRAIENMGKPQVTRPYLSISSASLCVTVSSSFKLHGKTHVICGDVRFKTELFD